MDLKNSSDNKEYKCGFVTLIGSPNVGKSTLFNQIIGQKISIITHKSQTTRMCIQGITIINFTQIILIDTPGIFRPKCNKLDIAMVKSAWKNIKYSDVILLIIDVIKGFNNENKNIIKQLDRNNSKNIWLILNKIDLIKKEKLLILVKKINDFFPFKYSFMINAKKDYGIKDLLVKLEEIMPKSVWIYPKDQITNIPIRLLAAELTREKLFLNFHDELPYSLTVETEKWIKQKDKSIFIQQIIYIQRISQKKIILGNKGKILKSIGKKIRIEISKILKQKVHLFLFVKVKNNWLNNSDQLHQIGIDI